MTKINRKFISILLAVMMVIAFMPVFAAPSHAAGNLILEATKVTFDSNSGGDNEWIFTADGSDAIKTAVVEDGSIATVSVSELGSWIIVYPVKDGDTNIVLTGENGDVVNIPVHVDKSYFIQDLKDRTSLSNEWYGSKKVYITSYAGAKGTMKIGKDKYNFTIGKSETKKIKLKRIYKLGTKIKITIKWKGYSAYVPFRIYSATTYDSLKASKHKVKVSTYNLHKGDYVKIIYKGKTYKKKITKDYDDKYKTVTVKVKKTLKKNSKLKIRIVNKNKKTLVKDSVKLVKWQYYIPDDDETGSEDE